MVTKNKDTLGKYLEQYEEAKKIISKNDKGSFACPNPRLYPYQWLWDSCFIAIGMRHYDIDRAKQEILSLFEGQWSNGMVPNMIMRKVNEKDPDSNKSAERIWRSWLNPYSPDELQTSGITQPPMIAEAVVKIGEKLSVSQRKSWYKQVYPSLLKYHEWLFNERDPHQEGLVLLIHPWECGMDNTPPWMEELSEHLLPWWIRALKSVKLDYLLEYFRKDTKYVPSKQRLSNVEAMALYSVQRRLRRKRYNFNRIIEHALFAIEDLTFNSIFIRANRHLKIIADTIDESLSEDFIHRAIKSEKALNNLWDEYAQEYFSRDFVSHRLLKQSSIAAFMPLYSGCITKDRAKRIIENLNNVHKFKTELPVPSVPLNSPWFSPIRYWQGPVWVNTNWLLIEGLKNYGEKDLANQLTEKTLKMVKDTEFSEYYNPIDGSPLGTSEFSWTASLTIDLIKNNFL